MLLTHGKHIGFDDRNPKMARMSASLDFLERSSRAETAYENGSEHNPSRVFVTFLLNPDEHHVLVTCGTCDGRGSSVDIIERNGRRVVLRTACPACQGRGLIDIARGPVTGDDYR
jgi:hypothetical protein